MKKIYLALVLGIFILSLAPMINAEELTCWRDAKQGTDIQLIQKCDTCTFNNITSIIYQNGTETIINELMTKNGVDYNYTLPDSTQIGKLIYSTIGDKDGADPPKQQTLCINITPSGFVGTLGFYILILVIALFIMILGFSIRDGWTVILGSFIFILLGLFILLNGIDGIKDNAYTYGIGIITIMAGSYIGIRASIEQMDL